jgi:hydroxylysine kinase
MDVLAFDPPVIGDDEIASIADEHYGLHGTMQRLRGERSHNTLFTTQDGNQVVLKIASPSEHPSTIDFHARALVHLEHCAPELPIARMIPSVDGELVPVLDLDGRRHSMRLVTYLPGVTFGDDQPISLVGMRAIGDLVGSLSAALAEFEHSAARQFMPWDIANGLILDAELWSGLGDDARSLLGPVRPRLAAALESMQQLPRQIIHNDAHGGNLLRSSPDSDIVTGMIDFGDLVHTVTVADLGVSGANLVPHQADPVAALAALAAGFNRHRPLSDAEVAALPELVLCRLTLSILLVEHQITEVPHIADAVSAERPGLVANLERWLTIDPENAADQLREAL